MTRSVKYQVDYATKIRSALHNIELPSGILRSSYFSAVASRGEEHDARHITRSYKETMCEDSMELGDPLAIVSASAQQQLKTPERAAAYNTGDMDSFAFIHEHEEDLRKWRAYHRKVGKHHAGISRAKPSGSGYHSQPIRYLST